MDIITKEILNIIQRDFPLVSAPFRTLGLKLNISPEQVLSRLKALKRQGVVRQISAIFDSAKLGYTSSLVAMQFPAERLKAAARIINQHPGVTHNYARNHKFNLWFTITLPPNEGLEPAVERLARAAEAERTMLLPALRTFKIGVVLDLLHGTRPERQKVRPEVKRDGVCPLEARDLELIGALEEDLVLVPRPFKEMADKLGMKEEEFLDKARSYLSSGAMRRFAAVLNHRQAGFMANAMSVWVVPDERVEEVGQTMASFSAVTHCYQRAVYPDWPYNLFAMVHGRNEEECIKVVSAIVGATGIDKFQLLYSTEEFKKVRMKYYRSS